MFIRTLRIKVAFNTENINYPFSRRIINGTFNFKPWTMLSMKTQYAFKALMYMAQQDKERPVLIAEIAEQKTIPLKFLENILLELKKAGILNSKKGKGGGYLFAKNPAEIKLATVMRLIDGPISLLPCVSLYFYTKCKNCDENFCGLNKVMLQVRDASLAILENKTVSDIAATSGICNTISNI